MFVRKEQHGFHWIDFHEIWYLSIFPKPVEKIQVSLNRTRIKGTLHEDQCTFLIISRSVRLRMKNVSEKSCGENRNTHFVFKKSFYFRKSCRLWDNLGNFVERGRTHMTVWQYTYIASLVVCILAVFVLWVGLKNRGKNKRNNIFYYIILSFFLS